MVMRGIVKERTAGDEEEEEEEEECKLECLT